MTDKELTDVLAEVGAAWLMDEHDEGCQTLAIRAVAEAAALAEREACAATCESVHARPINGAHEQYMAGKEMTIQQCAPNIRSSK